MVTRSAKRSSNTLWTYNLHTNGGDEGVIYYKTKTIIYVFY